MTLEIKQSLKLSQQLVMTPQLQQAIQLLQLNHLELQEKVHQEMIENPILEEAPDFQGFAHESKTEAQNIFHFQEKNPIEAWCTSSYSSAPSEKNYEEFSSLENGVIKIFLLFLYSQSIRMLFSIHEIEYIKN